MPDTKVVPAIGIAVTMGFPPTAAFGFGSYPAGWGSIAAKIVARSTEMKVKKAERVAAIDSVSNVRGNEKTQEITAATTVQTMVQVPPPVIVLRYFAPTKQWRP